MSLIIKEISLFLLCAVIGVGISLCGFIAMYAVYAHALDSLPLWWRGLTSVIGLALIFIGFPGMFFVYAERY